MHNFREMVEAGGLMAYAINMTDFIGRAARYAIPQSLLARADAVIQ